MNGSFSFASVILSYFLVGGGMFTATLVAQELGLGTDVAAYAVLGAGALVGGFIAARASRGETILEPAIGAVAVVATVVGLGATTPIGKLIWVVAQDQTMKFVGAVGLVGIVGALAGAFVSEKLLGEATRSSIPWLLYTALSTFGGSLLATLCASILVLGRGEAGTPPADNELGTAILIGIGVGCLLAGLAVGASARVRPLIAAFLGGGAGVAGFFALVTRTSAPDRDATLGLAALAGGGALVTLIGTALGWTALGRHSAQGEPAPRDPRAS
jgi:hypothetical protein